jgi:beta-glucosidase
VKEIAEVTYAKGYDDAEDKTDEALLIEAVKTAEEADVAVIFAGLPDNFESEGYDRKHLNMPDCQNTLIEKVTEVQKNVIVVLHNGSPVLMPWKDKVKGIVEAYLGGQAVGRAVVNILYGKVNPSGRLPETFPARLEDTPCYLTYGKGGDHAVYQEGVFVGYRYYTSVGREVLFPFGYGLSYTDFTYSDLKLDKEKMTDQDTLTVTVKVKNTGSRKGKEVVQLYVSPAAGETIRPVSELRGFEKIELESEQEKEVTFILDMRAFAYWNEEIHDWYVESGEYQIQIGKNSQEIVLSVPVQVQGTTELPKVYTLNSCLGPMMRDPKAQAVLGAFMGTMSEHTEVEEMQKQQEQQAESPDAAVSGEMLAAMMEDMPLRQLLSFVPGVTRQMLRQLVDALNEQAV